MACRKLLVSNKRVYTQGEFIDLFNLDLKDLWLMCPTLDPGREKCVCNLDIKTMIEYITFDTIVFGPVEGIMYFLKYETTSFSICLLNLTQNRIDYFNSITENQKKRDLSRRNTNELQLSYRRVRRSVWPAEN